ncbi:MAG: hypothetical protein ACHQ50_02030 [Fimbriimonadales bacterium]
MKPLTALLAAGFLCGAACAQTGPSAQALVDAAVAKAAKGQKNVFVVFHSPR